MMTLLECLEKIKSKKPDLYPIWYIEDKGKYYFNLLQRGMDSGEAPSSIFMVNPDNGEISGNIPIMWLYGNPELSDKLKKPHKISSMDQMPIKHAINMQGYGFSIIMSNDKLAHYGIKGQKWGVRRFQNEDMSLTPAGKERYRVRGSTQNTTDKNANKAEKKQSYFQKLRDEIETTKAENEAFQKKVDEIYNEHVNKHNPGFFEKKKYKDAAEKEAWLDYMEMPATYDEEQRNKSKEKDSKSTLATHAFYTAINPVNAIYLVSDGIRTLKANHREKSYLRYREEHSKLDKKTGLYKKTEGSYDDKADLSAVNPRYVDMNSNSKSNCMLCTTAYEMRKRGWDVTAQFDSVGYSFGDLKRWYPKAKMERNGRFDSDGKPIKQKEYIQNTITNLLKQGDGARGNLMVSWTNGGAHSMYYEVNNGKLTIKCGQSNTVYNDPAYILSFTDANAYARLDNVKPDLKKIKEECCY